MKMSTNYKSVLALIAAATVCANSSPAGEDAQPRDESGPPRKFQNLVTDDAALEAWLAIGPPQPEIILEGTPLKEVAWNTAKIFKNQFDLILPPADPGLSPMAVQMRLKDVRAIEVFYAMNLNFEVQKLPIRWKLALNGSRPIAILGMERLPAAAAPAAETEKIGQTVFPIPDILCASSPASDKQTADNLEDTVAAALRRPSKAGTRQGQRAGRSDNQGSCESRHSRLQRHLGGDRIGSLHPASPERHRAGAQSSGAGQGSAGEGGGSPQLDGRLERRRTARKGAGISFSSANF